MVSKTIKKKSKVYLFSYTRFEGKVFKEVKKEIENIIKRKWSIKYFCILLDQKLFRFCRISKSKVFIFVSKDFKRYYRTKEIEFEKALKVVCSTK